jgi:hypothetical protein
MAYFEDGKKERIEKYYCLIYDCEYAMAKYITYKNGIKHGFSCQYTVYNFNLMLDIPLEIPRYTLYVNGKRESLCERVTTNRETNKLRLESGIFKEGKVDGYFTKTQLNGNLEEKFFAICGMKYNEYYMKDEYGELRCGYKFGVLDGILRYKMNNKKEFVCSYQRGYKSGWCYISNLESDINISIFFVKNQIVKLKVLRGIMEMKIDKSIIYKMCMSTFSFSDCDKELKILREIGNSVVKVVKKL